MEEEFIRNQQVFKPQEEKDKEERDKMEDLRGSPMYDGPQRAATRAPRYTTHTHAIPLRSPTFKDLSNFPFESRKSLNTICQT